MMLRELARYLLKNRLQIPLSDWTTQGFGFLRLRINPNLRLHVWHSKLRVAGVSDIHDHTQWAFDSHIIAGMMVNVRFHITEDKCEGSFPHMMGTIQTGMGGGMKSEPKAVRLFAQKPELYLPGDRYHQEPDELHRSMPVDGTVTIIAQQRRDNEEARVCWPVGSSWGDAIPRHAHSDEVDEIGALALAIFDQEAS